LIDFWPARNLALDIPSRVCQQTHTQTNLTILQTITSHNITIKTRAVTEGNGN